MSESFLNDRVTLHCGDSGEILKTLADNSVDSVVCDPPYALVSITKRFGKPGSAPAKGNEAYMRASAGFMGKNWDTGETAFSVEFWAEVLRVLKPGGHVVAFSGTRSYHRLACAIEDAGFEIRDMIQWLYGSGFPKSLNVAKGIDATVLTGKSSYSAMADVEDSKGADLRDADDSFISYGADGSRQGKLRHGARREKTDPITDAAQQWQGWGTALKPACEPICFARKPLIGTVAQNVLVHGTGAINIDGCRVGDDGGAKSLGDGQRTESQSGAIGAYQTSPKVAGLGRWPANIIHDGSDEVIAAFPETADSANSSGQPTPRKTTDYGIPITGNRSTVGRGDSGSAARFFYTAKADADDRLGSKHPTVKPVDLMQWLVRLVSPKGGLVLDPFAGTGTTAEACFREGMRCMLVERETEYQADIRRRMALVLAGPDERKRESIKAKIGDDLPFEEGSLFA